MITRILTALVIGPACIFLTLWLPSFWFGVVLAGILLIGLYEWGKLSKVSLLSGGLAAGLFLLYLIGVSYLGRSEILIYSCWLGGLFWVIQLFNLKSRGLQRQLAPLHNLFEGMLLLMICWSALIWLHLQSPNGPLSVICMMASVWSADSFAYFAGRSFGKHKLAPEISPGKTIEGVIGGLFGTLIVSTLLAFQVLDLSGKMAAFWVLASLLAAAFSVAGDLFESRLKRIAGVKDSGSILPGHGGILDRIDGLIPAAPIFVLVWHWVA